MCEHGSSAAIKHPEALLGCACAFELGERFAPQDLRRQNFVAGRVIYVVSEFGVIQVQHAHGHFMVCGAKCAVMIVRVCVSKGRWKIEQRWCVHCLYEPVPTTTSWAPTGPHVQCFRLTTHICMLVPEHCHKSEALCYR